MADSGDINDNEELGAKEASQYRALSTRCNYLAAERFDVQYATKECSGHMPSPRVKDWAMLMQHLVRYLKGRPRIVQRFIWQSSPCNITAYSDSAWARCRETKKSTSGGCVMIGGHVVKGWSKTQSTIATSSGEAELNAAVKCAHEMIGI